VTVSDGQLLISDSVSDGFSDRQLLISDGVSDGQLLISVSDRQLLISQWLYKWGTAIN